MTVYSPLPDVSDRCLGTKGIAERSMELQGECRALWLSEEQEVDY